MLSLKYELINLTWKSKKFTKWLKNKYPNYDLHHVYNLRNLDLIQVPENHEEHLGNTHGKGIKKEYRDSIIQILIMFIMENCEEWKND